ncbi:GntR family transcriptional regulator [Lichenihabitans sp. Uapishka_5]|uniref:GntR family transcriptional regulator n=1 Tax=Lichenihabitans sp. Uapishka_5 TaxID=3037302 RepID=UPI0029E7FA9B|nr:GntR family transcriptional regulator [Lichenihabitans sp. Uapishka_5]MDX7950832.1 GntR family transcriptional regulator [Lichenihabitans sp. Uapishka_5]
MKPQIVTDQASSAHAELAERSGPPTLRREPLHALAADRLRRLVMRGEIAAGEKVNEVAIARALGVSRTPLREAVKLLASEGLLELLPGRGARVRRFSDIEILDHFEVIGALERHAAERAAERITPHTAADVRALQETMKASFREGRQQAYFQANQKMHALIVRLAESPVLEALHRELSNKARHNRSSTLTSTARWADSMREHEGWIEALLRGDGAQAGALILAHARRTGEAVLAQAAAADPAP